MHFVSFILVHQLLINQSTKNQLHRKRFFNAWINSFQLENKHVQSAFRPLAGGVFYSDRDSGGAGLPPELVMRILREKTHLHANHENNSGSTCSVDAQGEMIVLLNTFQVDSSNKYFLNIELCYEKVKRQTPNLIFRSVQ